MAAPPHVRRSARLTDGGCRGAVPLMPLTRHHSQPAAVRQHKWIAGIFLICRSQWRSAHALLVREMDHALWMKRKGGGRSGSR